MLDNEDNTDNPPRDRDGRLWLDEVDVEVSFSVEHVSPYLFEFLYPFFIVTGQADWAINSLPYTIAMAEVIRAQVDDWSLLQEFSCTFILENVPQRFDPGWQVPDGYSARSSVSI